MSPSPAPLLELLVVFDHGGSQRPGNLVITHDAVVVEEVDERLGSFQACMAMCFGRSGGTFRRIPFLQVLDCTIQPSLSASTPPQVVLSALTSTESKNGQVVTVRGALQPDQDLKAAEEWTQEVVSRAYKGVKPARRLLVLINPFGGSGQGDKIWRTKVHPIFQAAGCEIDTKVTERRWHGVEIGQDLDLDRYDAVVCVSGDGLVHELINGLGKRPDAERALRKTCIGVVPAGSGNALSVNNLGPIEGRNTVLAALSCIKGRPIPLDLCSVTQIKDPSDPNSPIEHTLSFLSQAFGLMADLDVGTEYMRWIGETRFIFGYLRGALSNRKQKCRLDLVVMEDDKDKINERWLERRKEARAGKMREEDEDNRSVGVKPAPEPPSPRSTTGPLPLLQFGNVTTPIPTTSHSSKVPNSDTSTSWQTLELDITSVYAGTLPWVSAELLQFPVKRAGDGSVDLLIHQSPGTWRTLASIQDVEVGSSFRNPDVRYFKTRAYRLTPAPTSTPSFVVVDGENFPYRAIQVEVHPAMMNVLSLEGSLGDKGVPEVLA